MNTYAFAVLALIASASGAEPQRKRSQEVHRSLHQKTERVVSEETYDRFLGMEESMSQAVDISMSMPPATRSPLPPGVTAAPTVTPTPEPSRSPLAEGETHTPTKAPTDFPTVSEVADASGASARSVAASLTVAAGAMMLF